MFVNHMSPCNEEFGFVGVVFSGGGTLSEFMGPSECVRPEVMTVRQGGLGENTGLLCELTNYLLSPLF